MPRLSLTSAAALTLTIAIGTPLQGQDRTQQPDFMATTVQMGAAHVRSMFTIGAEQMSDEDYAFKPTEDVRSFGQLLAHVAHTNYVFCSSAAGETSPVTDIEKTRTTKAEIRKALTESFEYCDRVVATMNDEKNAKAMRTFRDHPLPALGVLNFRNYHALLHWGNAITYMRLRGKVPPTA